MTPQSFSLTCNGTLITSHNHYYLLLNTVAKATATSKVCCVVWLLYGLVNVTSLQSPKIRGSPEIKIGLFIHTVLVNVTNRTFIHTVLVNVTNRI